jgi:hypothetical protein
MGDDSTPIDSR